MTSRICTMIAEPAGPREFSVGGFAVIWMIATSVPGFLS